MSESDTFSMQQILDSLNDGVYATDINGKIIYWSDSAKKITGWNANDVVGRGNDRPGGLSTNVA